MTTQQIATLVVLAVLLFWGVGAHQRLTQLRTDITSAFEHIEGQLKRRHELIPPWVEVAREHLAHERETLERVLAARNQAIAACDLVRSRPSQSGPLKSLAMAEDVLSTAMNGLRAAVEASDTLRADERFQPLSDELARAQSQVAFARQLFNDAALRYNDAARLCPANLVARAWGFKPATLLPPPSGDPELVVSKAPS